MNRTAHRSAKRNAKTDHCVMHGTNRRKLGMLSTSYSSRERLLGITKLVYSTYFTHNIEVESLYR